jgi:hypothetical protein
MIVARSAALLAEPRSGGGNCCEHCPSIASLAANAATVEPTLSRGDGVVAFAVPSALAAELAAGRPSLRTAHASTNLAAA